MPSFRQTFSNRTGILILSEKFLMLEGDLAKSGRRDFCRVKRVIPMRESYAAGTVDVTDADVRSHDFH